MVIGLGAGVALISYGVWSIFNDMRLYNVICYPLMGAAVLFASFLLFLMDMSIRKQPESRNIHFWNDCESVIKCTRDILNEHKVPHREYTFIHYTEMGRNELAREGVTSKMKIGIYGDDSLGRIFELEEMYRIIRVQEGQIGTGQTTHVQMWPIDKAGEKVYDIVEKGLRENLNHIDDIMNPPEGFENQDV